MEAIQINSTEVEKIAKNIPSQDFVHEGFDCHFESNLTDILVIFSTPRSGSTFLSDLIYTNNICLPHEYFQPFQYLPIMAKRWGCIHSDILNKEEYIQSLIKYRTFKSGWLGVNLHGHHLPLFSMFRKVLPKVNYHYVHIKREDALAQAVSYELAVQTGQWSSHFGASGDKVYNYQGIKKRLDLLTYQNNMIRAFICLNAIPCKTISYEQLVSETELTLKSAVPELFQSTLKFDVGLKKQASSLNSEWVKRFSEEYFYANQRGFTKEYLISKQRLKKYMKSLYGKVIR